MKDLTLNKEGGKDRHLRLSPDPHTAAHIHVHTSYVHTYMHVCVCACTHAHTNIKTETKRNLRHINRGQKRTCSWVGGEEEVTTRPRSRPGAAPRAVCPVYLAPWEVVGVSSVL